jgi:hypothetical protein
MNEASVNLEEAGIGKGISEVIVTTQSAAGERNAAPIGIITTMNEQEQGAIKYSVKLYKGSQTLVNVLETNTLAANVTADVVLFVRVAFENLRENYFTDFEGMPVLKEANAWIVFTTILAEDSNEYFRFRLMPKAVEIRRKEVKAINRGCNAVIEAAVLATRFEITKDEQRREEMRKERERYADIVKKCGGLREKEAMRVLQEKCPFR